MPYSTVLKTVRVNFSSAFIGIETTRHVTVARRIASIVEENGQVGCKITS
jgi:hypothetical protein